MAAAIAAPAEVARTRRWTGPFRAVGRVIKAQLVSCFSAPSVSECSYPGCKFAKHAHMVMAPPPPASSEPAAKAAAADVGGGGEFTSDSARIETICVQDIITVFETRGGDAVFPISSAPANLPPALEAAISPPPPPAAPAADATKSLSSENEKLRYQVLHLEAAVREGVQKLRQAMDVEAKLRYQIKHLIRAVKEADERLLSRGAAAVNDQGVQTDDGYETEYETCSSGSAEDA